MSEGAETDRSLTKKEKKAHLYSLLLISQDKLWVQNIVLWFPSTVPAHKHRSNPPIPRALGSHMKDGPLERPACMMEG